MLMPTCRMPHPPLCTVRSAPCVCVCDRIWPQIGADVLANSHSTISPSSQHVLHTGLHLHDASAVRPPCAGALARARSSACVQDRTRRCRFPARGTQPSGPRVAGPPHGSSSPPHTTRPGGTCGGPCAAVSNDTCLGRMAGGPGAGAWEEVPGHEGANTHGPL